MYIFIKKILKSVLPKQVLFKNELTIRKSYGLFHKGKTCRCNVCNKNLKSFIELKKSEDLICPFCGSLSRNRRLWQLLNENKDIKGNILHFSPSRSLYRNLKSNKEINYISTDFEDEFLADYKFDIINIDQESEKFDTIICYHILEHIIDDLKAIKELYRVLKPNGKVYIQTPYKEGDIYEDESIISPKERAIHFGQSDHVRIYSVEGLKKRLNNMGFKVDINTFKKDNDDDYNGFTSPETILIATK